MIRLNLVKGLGPVLQIAEGWTVKLPDEVTEVLMFHNGVALFIHALAAGIQAGRAGVDKMDSFPREEGGSLGVYRQNVLHYQGFDER